MTQLPRGASIEIERHTGEGIAGDFRSASGEEVILDSEGQTTSVRRSTIRRVRLADGNYAGRGTLWGLGIGALTGAVTGANVHASDPTVLVYTVYFAGIGAATGALVGLGWRKTTVIYEDTGSARVHVRPVMTPAVQGLHVSFTFD